MVKPYAMLTEAYNNTQTEFDTIEAATDMLDRLISKDKDPGTRALYDKFVQDLQGVSDDLLKNGLSPNSRRTLHRLKSYYNKYITAIQNAVTSKQAQIKQLQTLQAADDSIIPERDILGGGKEASLDRWVEDPNYTYGKVFSPRKEAELQAKKGQAQAAIMREALTWVRQEAADYTGMRTASMHPVAATFINMRDAGQFTEAYKYLMQNYPLRGQGSVLGDEVYDGVDLYAAGGFMDDGTQLPPSISTWIDMTGNTGGGGGGTQQPAGNTRRSSTPSSPAAPQRLQQQRQQHEQSQQRGGSTGRGGSKKEDSKPKKGSKKEEDPDAPMPTTNILRRTFFTPNIEGMDSQTYINLILNMMGISEDLVTDYGLPTQIGRKEGAPSYHYDGVGRQSYRGYGTLNLPFGYRLEEEDLKGTDAGKGAVGMKLVPGLDNGPSFPPHGPGRSKIKLFTENGWLMAWPSVKSSIQQGDAGFWEELTSSPLDLPQNELQVDQLRQRYGAIVQFFKDNIPTTDMGDGRMGYNINTFFDYVQQARENKNGPLGLSFWETQFTPSQQVDALDNLIQEAALTTGKGSYKDGRAEHYNIYGLEGWDKDGNPKLSAEPAEYDDFYETKKESGKESNGSVLRDPKAHIYISGNPNMNGIVLKYADKWYFIENNGSNLNSILTEAFSIASEVESSYQLMQRKEKELTDAFNAKHPDLDKNSREYQIALQEYLAGDEMYQQAVDDHNSLKAAQVNSTQLGLLPFVDFKYQENENNK